MASWGGCREGRGGGIRWVAQQHNPLGEEGEGKREREKGRKEEKERVCLRERGERNKGTKLAGRELDCELSRLDYKFDFRFFCLNSFTFFPTPKKIKL